MVDIKRVRNTLQQRLAVVLVSPLFDQHPRPEVQNIMITRDQELLPQVQVFLPYETLRISHIRIQLPVVRLPLPALALVAVAAVLNRLERVPKSYKS